MVRGATERAIAGAASLGAAGAAAGAHELPLARGPGTSDPIAGEMRRAGLLPLLVLHLLAAGPSYGNQLMDRVSALTGGLLAVNPNTMYPLLHSMEKRGLVSGEWEHPQRRSRRFYRLTAVGEAERARLAGEVGPRLDALATGLDLIRRHLGRPPARKRRDAGLGGRTAAAAREQRGTE